MNAPAAEPGLVPSAAPPFPAQRSAVQPPAVQPPAVQPPAVQPPAVKPPAVQRSAAQPSAADAAGGLGFPDAPRLELDQLLVQLRDRADDVLATQGRLRGLLRANALVAGELSLPLVLRQIVEAARDLLGARYAALGVLGRDGGLEQFVHVGMDDELVTRIGDLPRAGGSWAC